MCIHCNCSDGSLHQLFAVFLFLLSAGRQIRSFNFVMLVLQLVIVHSRTLEEIQQEGVLRCSDRFQEILAHVS